MICLSFDRFQLYKDSDKFEIQEMNTNGHYLAIMEVFSDSTDPARFLLPVCRQILIAVNLLFNFYRQSTGIEYQQVLSDF